MSQDVDLGGLNLVVNDIRVGASTPGAAGTSIGGGSETPGTVTASTAVVVDASKNITGFNNLGFGGLLAESTTVGITAGTTRTQAGAVALTTEINRVDTSTAPTTGTTLGDGVKLPPTASLIGKEIIIINNTANNIQVYGTGADTVNGITNTTGIFQAPNSVCVYLSATVGTWQSMDVALGYSKNFQTTSAVNGLTALVGGAQAGTALTSMINRVTAVANAADSVQLPSAVPGLQLFVANAAASNAMAVFPQTGETINALTANTAFSVAANKSAIFYCANTGAWHSVLTA